MDKPRPREGRELAQDHTASPRYPIPPSLAPFSRGAPGWSVSKCSPPHTSPPSSVWSTRQNHSPSSRYRRSGWGTPPPPGRLAFSVAEVSCDPHPLHLHPPQGSGWGSPSRLATRRLLTRKPLSPGLLCGAEGQGTLHCQALIAQSASYLACVRV